MENNILLDNKDVMPKNVNFIENSDVFIFINCDSNNKILHFCKNPYQLKKTYDISDYSSTYCIIEHSLNRKRFALASIAGEVTLYDSKSIVVVLIFNAASCIVPKRILNLVLFFT